MIEFGATGVVCAVGLGAAAACAAIRAGISRASEIPYRDRDGALVVGAVVPRLSLDVQFEPRLVELLALALRDCVSGEPRTQLQRVPLLVGLAEPDRPGGCVAAKRLIGHVEERLAVKFHPELSRTVSQGHAAGFGCLALARDILKTTDVPGCLVCGVDSYINASALHWLDRHWRLKRENNPDGVIPGEGAAVVFVRRPGSGPARVGAEVVGIGLAREPSPILSETPLLGLGLADATRRALDEAGWGFHEVDFRLSDVTGENYGFREHSLAIGRIARVVRVDPQPLWHPLEAIGDTGAAAGVIQLAVASAAWSRAYAPGPRAACFTSSVTGERAVAILQRPRVRGEQI